MRRKPPVDQIDAARRVHAKVFAKALRNGQTGAEAELWRHLRGRQLAGVKFRRQQPVEGRVIDFYTAEFRLGIEVDDPSHEERQEDDQQRQSMLEAQGIRIIRFTNEEVLNRTERVLARIEREIESRPRFRY